MLLYLVGRQGQPAGQGQLVGRPAGQGQPVAGRADSRWAAACRPGPIAFFSYSLLQIIPINHSLEKRPPTATGEVAADNAKDRASAAGHLAEAAEVHLMAAGRAAAS